MKRNIKDIYTFKYSVYDIVEEYIEGNYDDDDVLAIKDNGWDISIDVCPANKADISSSYLLKNLVREGYNGHLEPDNDTIAIIASFYF